MRPCRYNVTENHTTTAILAHSNTTDGTHSSRPCHPRECSTISSVGVSDDHANSAPLASRTSGTIVVGGSEYCPAATVRGLSATTSVESTSCANPVG